MNRFAILAAALMAIPTMATAQEKTDKPESVKPFRSYYDKDGDVR